LADDDIPDVDHKAQCMLIQRGSVELSEYITALTKSSKPPQILYQGLDMDMSLRSANKEAIFDSMMFKMKDRFMTLEMEFKIRNGEFNQMNTNIKYSTIPNRFYNGLERIRISTIFDMLPEPKEWGQFWWFD